MPTLSSSNLSLVFSSSSESSRTRLVLTVAILSSSPNRLSAAFFLIVAAFLHASTILSRLFNIILRVRPKLSNEPDFIRLSKTFLFTLKLSTRETKSSISLNSPLACSSKIFSIAAPPTPFIAPKP